MKINPKVDGYYMPAEFEEHSCCWMIWPERVDNWRLCAKPAMHAFTEVAKVISKYESVKMCVSKNSFEIAKLMLPSDIELIVIDSDDAWMRDIGPTFIKNKDRSIRAIDWGFNAWGGFVDGLYYPWDKDEELASKICELESIEYYSVKNLVLEGGSFHTDGEGTLIVTEECLLHKSRNPHLSKQEIEEILKTYLNVEKVLWLPYGIYNDETNGHVDNILHYCSPGEVVIAWTDDRDDVQYERSLKCYEYLSNCTDAKGRKFRIHKLHLPTPITVTKEDVEGIVIKEGTHQREVGHRLVASYVNFYLANNAVILPIFNDLKYDKLAVDKLKEIFPNREIETVYAKEIILGGGSIHCITQQQPKGE